jgi:hypothetical protein
MSRVKSYYHDLFTDIDLDDYQHYYLTVEQNNYLLELLSEDINKLARDAAELDIVDLDIV